MIARKTGRVVDKHLLPGLWNAGVCRALGHVWVRRVTGGWTCSRCSRWAAHPISTKDSFGRPS